MMTQAPLYDPNPQALLREERLFAGVAGRRFLAWVLDNLAIAALTFLILVLTAFLASFILVPVYIVVGFLYRWFALARNSSTPGMRAAGLILVDRHRAPDGTIAMTLVDSQTGLFHTLVYSLSMAFVLPQVLSVLLILLSREKRSLADLAMGTAAVRQDALW